MALILESRQSVRQSVWKRVKWENKKLRVCTCAQNDSSDIMPKKTESSPQIQAGLRLELIKIVNIPFVICGRSESWGNSLVIGRRGLFSSRFGVWRMAYIWP